MTEFEGFTSADTVFSEFEKAMEDTVVSAAARIAADRAHPMTEEEADPTVKHGLTDATTVELDTMVTHVIDSGTDISGMIQLCRNGDESKPISVHDAYGEFKGFVICRRKGRIEYDFLFTAFSNQDDEVLSREKYQEMAGAGLGAQIKTETIQARVGDVYMNFDSVHPTRAMAWLSISYPEIIEGIDQLVLDTEGTDAQKLHALKDFSYLMPKDMPESESKMLQRSIGEYARGLASVDYEVPYNLVIDGPGIKLADSYSQMKKMLLKRRALFTVSYLDIYTEDKHPTEESFTEGVECKLALYGQLHSSELDGGPSLRMMVPLQSIATLTSQRLQDRRRAAQQASGETA